MPFRIMVAMSLEENVGTGQMLSEGLAIIAARGESPCESVSYTHPDAADE